MTLNAIIDMVNPVTLSDVEAVMEDSTWVSENQVSEVDPAKLFEIIAELVVEKNPELAAKSLVDEWVEGNVEEYTLHEFVINRIVEPAFTEELREVFPREEQEMYIEYTVKGIREYSSLQ